MNLSPVQRFWKLIQQFRSQVRQIYIYAIFNGLVNLSLPLGIQSIINLIQGGEVSTSWVLLVVFVLIGIIIMGFLEVLQLRIVEDIQQEVFARSAFEFAYRLPKIQLLELDKKHAPELVNRFFDTLTIQKSLPKILIDFSLASFQIIFGLILLSFYSSYFILLSLILIIVIWLILRVTGPKGLATSLQESKYKYELVHWLEEVARVNKSLKLRTTGGLHLSKTDIFTAKYIEARENHFKVLLSQFKYFIGFKVLVAASLLIVGSLLVFQQKMNIGQFVAAEIIIILIINSILKIIKVFENIYDTLTALEKIGHVSDLNLDEEKGKAIVERERAMSVEGVQINFSFPDMQGKSLFEDLSFKVPPKARALIIGQNGSGKSTLLQLLAGIYPLNGGKILLNDIPLANYDRSNLYTHIGIYLPSNQIFKGSIKENITMGVEYSEEAIFEIIQFLELTRFVTRQQEGIETVIDPEGRRLPKSIVEKLLFARMLIGSPKLLLIEDSSSALMTQERNKIIDYIMDSQQEWTVIVVSDYPYWKEKQTQVIKLD